uniref:SHSP domain-containing protein n=1 Tax=Parastrongyloides trichosuri TaxID=131310 RepID=A0A0N4Z1F4_PARTI
MDKISRDPVSSPFSEAKRFFANIDKLMETPLYWTHSKFSDKHEIDDKNVEIKDNKKDFSIKMDVSNFAPDELKVDIHDGCLIVEGKHEEKNHQYSSVKKTFVRSYSLPHGVNAEDISSELSDEGVLTIHKKSSCVDNNNIKIIPITYE